MIGRFLATAAAGVAALIAVVVGLFAAAVLVIAVFYDEDDLKRLAAGAASAAIGRTLEIRGDADLDLGRVTRVQLNDVTLANASWAATPNMAQIARLTFAIDVGKLLRGHIVLPEVEVVQPNILLEKNGNGEPNWRFSAGAQAVAEGAAPERRAEIPVLEKLTIADGVLVYRDPTIERTARLDLTRLTVRDDLADRRVVVEGDGSLDHRPFMLRFAGGPWALLQSAEQPYPVDLDATVGDLRVKIAGTVADPAQAQGIGLKLDVRGENTANLFPLTGLALPPSPPYSFTGRLDRRGDEWQFSDAVGRVGDSDMRGTIGVVLGRDRPLLKADLTSNMLNFKDLGPFIGARPGGREEESQAAREAQVAQTGRVLPDKPIDLARLKAMDAEVAFQARRIEAPDLLPIDRLSTKLTLNAGTLRIQPAEAALGAGKVRFFLSLYGAERPVRSDIDAQIERVNLKEFLRGSGFAQETAGLLGGRIKLSATGTSIAQILASATGDTFVVMSNGQLSHLLVELAGLDIAESLGVLIEGDEPIPVRCIVADLRAEQGVFRTNTFVVDTTDTNIAGRGTIDMREEKLDMTLYPVSKDFSPLSMRAPVSIAGSFAAPTVFPDPVEIGVETTVKKVVNAILTPVLGLLPPIDAGVGENSDCSRLIRQAQIKG